MRFADPIERARHLDATRAERTAGHARANELRRLLSGRILQRTKASLREAAPAPAPSPHQHAHPNPDSDSDSSSALQERSPSSSQRMESGRGEFGEATAVGAGTGAAPSGGAVVPELPPKHELVLWVGLR